MSEKQSAVLNSISHDKKSKPTLQINRLIKFIQNKQDPNFNNLKQILKLQKNYTDMKLEHQYNQNYQIKQVAINTRNIFVAKNKTETSTPRFKTEQKNKQTQKINSHSSFLKLQTNCLKNKQQKIHSNLFPPVHIVKRIKSQRFQRYEDSTTKWLNSEIKSQRKDFHDDKTNIIDVNKIHRININLNQRQKYNISLQKLIEKALRIKDKYKQDNNKIQEQSQNPYASKGKLIQRKIKKDLFKILNPQSVKKSTNQELNVIDPQNLLSHSNQNLNTNKSQQHSFTFINKRKQKKQLKFVQTNFINDKMKQHTHKQTKIQRQIIHEEQHKRPQTIQKSSKLQQIMKLYKKVNKKVTENTQFQMQKNQNKNKAKIKIKTEGLNNNKKPSLKWDLTGYQWQEAEEQNIQQNLDIQNYVQQNIKS